MSGPTINSTPDTTYPKNSGITSCAVLRTIAIAAIKVLHNQSVVPRTRPACRMVSSNIIAIKKKSVAAT